jgi:hypothetical protein
VHSHLLEVSGRIGIRGFVPSSSRIHENPSLFDRCTATVTSVVGAVVAGVPVTVTSFPRPHCTWSVVLVERTSEPVAAPDVPVIVMVYAPVGVPWLPPPPPPPQAA